MSQITTHILDTSKGRPAAGINVVLEKSHDQHHWNELSKGVTNSDGRVSNLLPNDIVLEPGVYRLVFNCGKYFEAHGIKSFYPYVTIVFETHDTSHYHVPLLLNPFGYSTYRGS